MVIFLEFIKINTEYITLGQFLKMADIISSGGMAKLFLSENTIFVDNEVENRRGRKLYPKMIVRFLDKEYQIIND